MKTPSLNLLSALLVSIGIAAATPSFAQADAAAAVVTGESLEAAAAASAAYQSQMAGLIGRSGDVFVFCYEGGDGGTFAQGWYPTSPASGGYVITRYCKGVPCPNWKTLMAYQSICPQAHSMGVWIGPGGPGAVGQYQSSGGSKFVGNPADPVTGLAPMPH